MTRAAHVPDISIIIPMYNTDAFIVECLDSVVRNVEQLEDAGYTAEVLIIDDGSTDTGPQLAKTYAKNYDAVEYCHQENEGLSVARNRGVRQARGRYIEFVDSDDFLFDHTCVKALQTADSTNCDMVVFNAVRYDGEAYSTSTLHFLAFRSFKENITHITRNHNLVYDATVWNKLIRRSFYVESGLEFPEGKFFEDTPVTLRLHCLARSVAVMLHTGYAWRVRVGAAKSITQRNVDTRVLSDRLEMMGQVIEYADSLTDEPELGQLIRARFMEWDFRRALLEMHGLEPSAADECFSMMRSYAMKYYVGFKGYLSAFSKQLTLDFLANNREHAMRVQNYRHVGYNRARVVEDEDGRFIAHFPSSLFHEATCDVSQELQSMPARCFIDKAEALQGGSVAIYGHVYRQRVNYPYPKSQTVKAYLQNDRTGNRVELPCAAWRCKSVTRAHGLLLCYDDFCRYEYDYDGSGFKVSLDFESLELDESMLGDNYIALAYENRLEADERLLTGMSVVTKRALAGVTYASGERTYAISVDCRNAVVLSVR